MRIGYKYGLPSLINSGCSDLPSSYFHDILKVSSLFGNLILGGSKLHIFTTGIVFCEISVEFKHILDIRLSIVDF